MDRDTLLEQLALVDYVVTRNVEGISHDDSLKAAPHGGNSINWIMGHMVNARNATLGLLGAASSIDKARYALYADEPMRDPTQAVRFGEMVASFKAMQPRLAEGLRNLSAKDATKPAALSPTANPKETLGSLLVAVVFHEAYHAGQIGIVRRLIGKPGVLKGPSSKAAS